MCVLIFPSEVDEHEYNELINEFITAGEDLIPSSLDRGQMSFSDYIQNLGDYAAGTNLSENHVPASTYFLSDRNGHLIGAANIRHELNEFLKMEGGHIGVGIRPSARGRGYGTQTLALALEKARELNINPILVTCDKNNTRSAAVIQKNGGVLDSEIEKDDAVTQRYWIRL